MKKVCILYSFITCRSRAQMLRQFFEDKGCRVTLYTSDYDHWGKKYIEEKDEKTQYIHVSAYRRNMSPARIFSHMSFGKQAIKEISKEQYDLIWVMLPPNSLVKRTTEYRKSHTEPQIVFDCLDMWPETLPVTFVPNILTVRAWKNLRDRYLNNADFLVTECRLFQKLLGKKHPDLPAETLYFRYFTNIENDVKMPLSLPENKLSLCYLGAINHVIDISAIERVVRALLVFRPVCVHIIGDGESRKKLVARLQKAGAEVIFHGRIFEEDKKAQIFAMCHYGINIMKKSVCVGLTMKSMDYWENGLPVLNTITGDTWEFIKNEKVGYNITDSVSYEAVADYDISARARVKNFYRREFAPERFDEKMAVILSKLEENNQSEGKA